MSQEDDELLQDIAENIRQCLDLRELIFSHFCHPVTPLAHVGDATDSGTCPLCNPCSHFENFSYKPHFSGPYLLGLVNDNMKIRTGCLLLVLIILSHFSIEPFKKML